MKYIDNFLNGITMYRLILYGLFIFAGISMIFGFFDILPYTPLQFLLHFLVLTVVCYTSNYIFGKILRVHMNVESSSISALILFFVLSPIKTLDDAKFVVLVGVIAMASKYILAPFKKHIFNPVAISVFIIGVFGSPIASWWVGSDVLLAPTIILGFLSLRKVRRFELFSAFIVTGVIGVCIVGNSYGISIVEILKQTFLSGPFIFFSTIMLTEPLTTPPSKRLQVIYGIIVGVLYGAQFHFGPVYSTPGLALIVGNIFSYLVSPRPRLVLTLLAKNQLSSDVYEFIWKKEGMAKHFSFIPGQYLEWTLEHAHSDGRGNRRFFTIASSPTETEINLGTKFYPKGSSFKNALLELNPGSTIIASQLAGEFTLPKDTNKKLIFIAGGIGITPFRSMVKHMIDKAEVRDAVLFFSNKTPADIVYKDIFTEAQAVGLQTVYVVNELAGTVQTSDMRTGYVTADMIMKEVPDYKERMYYISGSHGMVEMFKTTLQKAGVPKRNIRVDFFPGFA